MLNFKKHILVLTLLPLTFGSYLNLDNSQSFANPYPGELLLAQHEMSLDNRYPNKFVNEVFKDNILLNLAYLDGRVVKASDIKWEQISKPFRYELTLNPNKTFAFHDMVEAKYEGSVVKTSNTHFNAQEGFKTDGFLFGDGVCHLASLINWVAKQAGLSVEAPTNHDFANIPDIPKEYGVSIYSTPGTRLSNALQNLYVTNNKDQPISFRFEYQDNKVKVSVVLN